MSALDYGYSPDSGLSALMHALSMIGQPGVPVDFSDPGTLRSNPAIAGGLQPLSALSAGPLMAGMMGGMMPTNGFSVTHVNVQPGKLSQQQKNANTSARRDRQNSQIEGRAIARRAQQTAQTMPACQPVNNGQALA